MTSHLQECIYCGEEIVPILNGHICDEHEWMQHTANLTSRIATLQAENAKQKDCIEQMIKLAAAKHRPAYDEQQTVIMGLRDEIASLKAELTDWKKKAE